MPGNSNPRQNDPIRGYSLDLNYLNFLFVNLPFKYTLHIYI